MSEFSAGQACREPAWLRAGAAGAPDNQRIAHAVKEVTLRAHKSVANRQTY